MLASDFGKHRKHVGAILLAARNTPSRGAKPDKLARDAIMVALNREMVGADGRPTKRLYVIADKLTELAAEGDISAIKEVFDRVDGKATQSLDAEGVAPLTVVIRKFDFETDGTETDPF